LKLRASWDADRVAGFRRISSSLGQFHVWCKCAIPFDKPYFAQGEVSRDFYFWFTIAGWQVLEGMLMRMMT